jgi:hypothetical protein
VTGQLSTSSANNWSDYAVLVIAIHSALQVFYPVSQGGSDGLYNYRYYIYFGSFVAPSVMSGLAFANPNSAYLSQGAFCTLPLRPFWYRLALAWIPRYLIALIIICLAAAIYAYVGFEFRSYANLTQEMQTPVTATSLSPDDRDMEIATDGSQPNMAEQAHQSLRRASSLAHDVFASQRRGSAIAFTATTYGDPSISTQSWPGRSMQRSSGGSTTRRPPLFSIPSGHTIKSCPTNDLYGPVSPFATSHADPLASMTITQNSTALSSIQAPDSVQRHLECQRRRVHRQLRLMFIYPLVYTLMWLIPFLQHCMTYSNKRVAQPVWFLRIGATVCITSMGFVDCVIFSVREKPWRSITTSDGTVWGSLSMWRTPTPGRGGEEACVAVGLERSTTGSERLARIRNSLCTRASGDFTRIAAEQARCRLEGEREERMKTLQERTESGSEAV